MLAAERQGRNEEEDAAPQPTHGWRVESLSTASGTRVGADRARKRDQGMKRRRDAVREEQKMIGGVPIRSVPLQTDVRSRVDTSDGRNVRRCSPPPLRATQYLPLCPRWRRHRRRCNPHGRPSPAGYVATVDAARLPVLAKAVVERVARLSRARRGGQAVRMRAGLICSGRSGLGLEALGTACRSSRRAGEAADSHAPPPPPRPIGCTTTTTTMMMTTKPALLTDEPVALTTTVAEPGEAQRGRR